MVLVADARRELMARRPILARGAAPNQT